MKITFLGTGAADWSIKEHKHIKGFRRNSSALIDDCLLIDPGPDVPDALQTFGKKPEDIRFIINTHRHWDHYCEETIKQLKDAVFFEAADHDVLRLGKYQVTALKAHHGTCENAVHFIISDGEKNLFYGLDSAWLLYDEVTAIKESKIDYAVLDCTVGNHPGDYRIFEHNNINMILEMKHSLQPYIKRFCISHMARTLHDPHDVLAEQMKPEEIEVAFDGYETII